MPSIVGILPVMGDLAMTNRQNSFLPGGRHILSRLTHYMSGGGVLVARIAKAPKPDGLKQQKSVVSRLQKPAIPNYRRTG